jgi:hypothetical protein
MQLCYSTWWLYFTIIVIKISPLLSFLLTYMDMKQGVCHMANEESWKLNYFTMQKYNLQKIPLQETKILQDIITL